MKEQSGESLLKEKTDKENDDHQGIKNIKLLTKENATKANDQKIELLKN